MTLRSNQKFKKHKKISRKKDKNSSKESKINKIFYKYSYKGILSYNDFKRLVKNEFHMYFSNSVYKSALHTWGSVNDKKRFFTKENFHNMFTNKNGKEGFFRFIYI